MGRKKRNASSGNMPSQLPAPEADAQASTGAADTVDRNVGDLDQSAKSIANISAESESTISESTSSEVTSAASYASVKLECERVVSELKRGNQTKALKMIKDLFCKHENSPYSAIIHRIQGTVFATAVSTSDDSKEKRRHLENAIESARKAVRLSPSSVEFAYFYAKLLYQAANEPKEFEEVTQECERALAIENPADPAKDTLADEIKTTAEARISKIQSELRSLIQRSNIASVSTWTKNVSGGEDKFRFVPVKSAPEDPAELGVVEERTLNELPKVSKTSDERRKEIEVKVAAARLIQQKSESPHSGNDEERRQSIDNNTNNRKDSGLGSGQRVRERRRSGNMRKAASSGERMDLVKVYWNTLSSEGKKDFLTIRISDLRSHFTSFKDGEVSKVLNEALSFGEANKVWKFWTCCTHSDEKFADASSFMHHVVKEHFGSLSPKLQKYLPKNVDDEVIEMIRNSPWKPVELNEAFRMLEKQLESGTHVWTFSDDPERTKLLERIHTLFEAFIKYNCLALSHLSKVVRFALEELQGIAGGSLLDFKGNQTPSCICFLGAPKLKKILNFMQEICEACELDICSKKDNMGDDSSGPVQDVVIMDKIIVGQDALVIDGQCLPCSVHRSSGNSVVNDASGAPIVSHVSYENGVVLDSDALLSWIFTCASASEQLGYWKDGTEKKAQQGLEILQLLEEESYHLQCLCERKCEHLSYEEALRALEDLCLEEGKKTEHAVGQSYDYVLKKRREELINNDSKISIISNRFELDTIANVLKDAYSDSCVEAAIQRQKERVSTEISSIDARIMRISSGIRQLEVKLEAASHHDFRSILLPLVKLFVQARVEGLAEKDAQRKADAVRDEILADLEEDSKKGGAVIGGSKHVHERKRDKKKSRENRKNKDRKDTNNDRLLDQTAKEMLNPSDHEEEDPGSGIASSGRVDALQLCNEEYQGRIELEAEEGQLEETLEYQRQLCDEEYQQRIELEADARRLEELLEYQRQLENEAKHLAEQHKRTLSTTIEKTESVEMLEEQSDDDKNGNEQQTNRKEGELVYTEGTAKNNANEPSLRTDDCLPLKPDVENSDHGLPRSARNSPGDGDNGENTLKQHLVEEDNEERFQADFKKEAVHQSLAMPDRALLVGSVLCSLKDGDKGKETHGTGLKNEAGEYNCFLNVIIQSLWHLRRFREEFLGKSTSEHIHFGDPCVICALYDIFIAMSKASTDNRREAISPTSLRLALSNLHPDSNFFQEGQMNDASEVLGVMFNYLHRSFTPACGVSNTESVDGKCRGTCIAHLIFGMDILERMNCYNCRLESRCLKYTSFFHHINANALRTMKVKYPENSFDELLNRVQMNYQLPCDPENGGCGKPNYIRHLLSSPPHVFTTVLGWKKTCENVEEIKATLAALSTDIDISVLYRGLDPHNRHRLVSVVCYCGLHYRCFAYSHDHEQWIMCDDETVKVIGCWSDVLAMCESGSLQPQVLLFEAVNSDPAC